MSEPNKRQKMEGTCGGHSISDEIFDPTTQDFARIRECLGFVDHTPLIELFFGSGKKFKPEKLFVSAPSHFCKSSNMDMIRLYYGTKKDAGEVEKTKKTFEGLKIMDNPHALEHFCAHPVLFVDLKVTCIESYHDAVAHCFFGIRKAYLEHQAFLEMNLPDDDSLKGLCQEWCNTDSWEGLCKDESTAIQTVILGLETLCQSLFIAHGKKRVLVLVDESDAVVTAALGTDLSTSESESGEDKKLPEKVAVLMEEVFGYVSKGAIEKTLQGLLLTGISDIIRSGIGYSRMIKTTTYRFLCDKSETPENPLIRDLIVQNYGLHERHLSALLTKLDQKGKLRAPIDEIAKVIKENYNGYYYQKKQCVFSLWSVMFYLSSGNTTDTYSEMGYVGKCYKKAFLDVEVGRLVLKLIAKQEITIEYIQTVTLMHLLNLRNGVGTSLRYRNILFSSLLDVGFLTNTEKQAPHSPGQMNVKVPNEEIRTVFHAMFIDYDIQVGQFDNCYVKQCTAIVGQLLNTCLSDDDSLYKSYLKSLHGNLVELFKGFPSYRKEELSELQCLMWFALTYTHSFKPIREYITVENGQADLWLKYREFYVVFELKVSKGQRKDHSSLYALQQMKGEVGRTKINYTAELQGKAYLLIGLSMDENLAPSMCVETSKSTTQIVVSKTEQAFPCFREGYYNGCYDLFQEKFVA